MSIRRVFLGSTVAVVAVACVPAVAQAAPVNPAQAVLAAHEFPFGSTGYEVETEVLPEAGALPDGKPAEGTSAPEKMKPCAEKLDAMLAKLSGATVVEAEAKRGATEIESTVINRTLTAAFADTFAVCDATLEPGERSTLLPAPGDLARLRPVIFRDENEIQAWVDVRGVAVNVKVESKNRSPVDTDAFWQTLRAQVAKVERQP